MKIRDSVAFVTGANRGMPLEVVRQALRAVEAGCNQVLTDDMNRQVKAGLSDREGIYLNFDSERAVHAAR